MNVLLRTIVRLRNRFTLRYDTERADDMILSISKSAQFKGTRIWVLIFAIFIASLGLNVNSTAVIIGAMLISPLMGPIMGIGLGVALLDLPLIKSSVRNYAAAIIVSLASSTIYFLITPLHKAQSELLARTAPNIYDVLIALFGGFAGIVAAASKEKGNVIPGVAIATALMPPLCTAGYGLATAQWSYFIGAFYLFFINTVFISLSTIIVVQLLHIRQVSHVDKGVVKRIRILIYALVIITIVPSIFLTYKIIKKSIFVNNAENYVNTVFKNEAKADVLYENYTFDTTKPTIELICFGQKYDSARIAYFNSRLKDFSLTGTSLLLHQDVNSIDRTEVQSIRSSIMQDITKTQQEQNQQLVLIQQLLNKSDTISGLNKELVEELYALDSNLQRVALHNNVFYNYTAKRFDTVPLLIYKLKQTKPPVTNEGAPSWIAWIKKRIKADTLAVIREQ